MRNNRLIIPKVSCSVAFSPNFSRVELSIGLSTSYHLMAEMVDNPRIIP